MLEINTLVKWSNVRIPSTVFLAEPTTWLVQCILLGQHDLQAIALVFWIYPERTKNSNCEFSNLKKKKEKRPYHTIGS